MKQIPMELLMLLNQLSLPEINNLNVSEHWKLLQKAHRLSQPFYSKHTKVHFLMMKHAFNHGYIIEAFIQAAFTLVATPSSVFNRYPKNHPGTITIT